MRDPGNGIEQDLVFSALADRTRRTIIEMLHQKDSTLLELSKSFDMSFQALSKHIKVLEYAGILSKERQGKYQQLSLKRDTLRECLKWISYYSDFWNQSFDKLDVLVSNIPRDGDIK